MIEKMQSAIKTSNYDTAIAFIKEAIVKTNNKLEIIDASFYLSYLLLLKDPVRSIYVLQLALQAINTCEKNKQLAQVCLKACKIFFPATAFIHCASILEKVISLFNSDDKEELFHCHLILYGSYLRLKNSKFFEVFTRITESIGEQTKSINTSELCMILVDQLYLLNQNKLAIYFCESALSLTPTDHPIDAKVAQFCLIALKMYDGAHERTVTNINQLIELSKSITFDDRLIKFICDICEKFNGQETHLALQLSESILKVLASGQKVPLLNLEFFCATLYYELNQEKQGSLYLDKFFRNLQNLQREFPFGVAHVLEKMIKHVSGISNDLVLKIEARHLNFLLFSSNITMQSYLLNRYFFERDMVFFGEKLLRGIDLNNFIPQKLDEEEMVELLTASYLGLRSFFLDVSRIDEASFKMECLRYFYIGLTLLILKSKDKKRIEKINELRALFIAALKRNMSELMRKVYAVWCDPDSISQPYWIDTLLRGFYCQILSLVDKSIYSYTHHCKDNCNKFEYHYYLEPHKNREKLKDVRHVYISHVSQKGSYNELRPDVTQEFIDFNFSFLKLDLLESVDANLFLELPFGKKLRQIESSENSFFGFNLTKILFKLEVSIGTLLALYKEANGIYAVDFVKLIHVIVVLWLHCLNSTKPSNVSIEKFSESLSKLILPAKELHAIYLEILANKDVFENLISNIYVLGKKLLSCSQVNNTLTKQINTFDLQIEKLLNHLGVRSFVDIEILTKLGKNYFSFNITRNQLIIEINKVEILDLFCKELVDCEINFDKSENTLVIDQFRSLTELKLLRLKMNLQKLLTTYEEKDINNNKQALDGKLNNSSSKNIDSFSNTETEQRQKKPHDPNKLSKNQTKSLYVLQRLQAKKQQSAADLNKAQVKIPHKKSTPEPLEVPAQAKQQERDETEPVKSRVKEVKNTVTIIINNPKALENVLLGIRDNELEVPAAYPELNYASTHFLQLKHVIDELNSHNRKYEDSDLILRYYVLYHCTRLLVIFYETKLNLPNTLKEKIIRLRMILAKSPGFFLDPESTSQHFFSKDPNSIFCITRKIYHHVRRYLSNIPISDDINLHNNLSYNYFYPDDAKINFTLPKQTFDEILKRISSKIQNRLMLFLSKIDNHQDLVRDPFRLDAIKMLLAEVGYLARQLREQGSFACKKYLKSDLQFNSFDKHLVEFFSKQTITSHKNFLSVLNNISLSDFTAILKSLSLADSLIWCIEIRNSVDHDHPNDSDEVELPYYQELATPLIFIFAQHILTLPVMMRSIEFRPELNPNAKVFVPQYVAQDTRNNNNSPYLYSGGIYVNSATEQFPINDDENNAYQGIKTWPG